MALGMAGVLYIGHRSRLFSRAEYATRIGITLAHAAYVFLLVAFVMLLKFVASSEADASTGEGAKQLHAACVLVVVWLGCLAWAHLITQRGQAAREALRETQIAAGRVWTRTSTLGHNYGATVVQQQVDIMSDEELARKVCFGFWHVAPACAPTRVAAPTVANVMLLRIDIAC